ncbi:MAG TPA: hypothetical protein VFU21_02815 [Kofleriaceae bacterium]|nr:hypothetical protein [Kofleriaceae bacterium]
MRVGWPVLLAVVSGCGSDEPSGTGFAGGYRTVEVRQDDTCGGEGVVIDTDPALAWFDLVDEGGAIEWRTCSGEDSCEGTGEPVGGYPRRFDEQTGAETWRGWLDATDDAGTLCNYFFYSITLARWPTDLLPDQIVLAERELRESRAMDACTRPDDVTVDTAPCLAQRIIHAVPR